MADNTKFNEVLDNVIDRILKYEEDQYHSEMQTWEAYSAPKKMQLKDEFLKIREEFIAGYHAIIEEMEEMHQNEADFSIDHYRFTEERMQKYRENQKNAVKSQELKTPQDLFEYTDEELHVMYEAAVSLMERKEHEKGANAFIFLTQLSPMIYQFWQGAGVCLEDLERYEDALNYHSIGLTTNPSSIPPYVNVCRCFLKLNLKPQAIEIANMAIKYADEIQEEEEREAFLDKAKFLLSEIENK